MILFKKQLNLVNCLFNQNIIVTVNVYTILEEGNNTPIVLYSILYEESKAFGRLESPARIHGF